MCLYIGDKLQPLKFVENGLLAMLTIYHLLTEQRITAEQVKCLFYLHTLHTLFNLKQKHVSKVSTPVPKVWVATIAAHFPLIFMSFATV